jgi:5-methylcytosine-specific restriction protein A
MENDRTAVLEAIQYRAVHTKTSWRKAGGHGSIESAIFGRNGAAGLFAGKVRTDYARHGEPLYVVVWQSSHSTGKLIRRGSGTSSGIDIVDIPVVDLERFDSAGGAAMAQLARYFQ